MNGVVTNNSTNKNQCDDNIYESKFDNKFCLSIRNKYHLPVVTISLRGGKKDRATVVYVLTILWDSGATCSMIKR